MSELAFPEIAEPTAALAIVQPVKLDLAKIDLTDVALAQFGPWREAVADVTKNIATLALDLSNQARIDEAKSLRHRLIGQPRAAIRNVSKELKSKLAKVSKAIGAEEDEAVKAYDAAEAPLTLQIDAAQKVIDDSKEAARVAEVARLATLREAITVALTAWGERCMADGITAERIGRGIDLLVALDPEPAWSEVVAFWQSSKAQTLATMRGLQVAAQQREDTARLEAQRLENERVAAENARIAADLAAQRAEVERQLEENRRMTLQPPAIVVERHATETLTERLLRLAGQLSCHEAAEGDAYHMESAAREVCRARFNAAVQEAIVDGTKVDLRRFLVPTTVMEQLAPIAASTDPTGLADEACRPATAKETAHPGTDDAGPEGCLASGAGDDAKHAGDLRGPEDTTSGAAPLQASDQPTPEAEAPRPVAYLYHDAQAPEDAHPWLHSTMVVMAADRRPKLRNETPLVTLAQAEAMVAAERERWTTPAELTLDAALSAQRAEIDRLRALLARLTEWMAEQGLLHYHDHCKRPDGSSGPAWVVRKPATVWGDACEAWHPYSAAGAVEAWLSGPNVAIEPRR